MTAGYRTRRVDLGEVTLTLDEWPEAGGRPVLFLHAAGFSRGVWRPVAAGLLDICRPIALDLRGHGDTRTALAVGDWTAMADDVERLAEIEGWSDLVIVGHSLGDAVGMLLTLERPELISALILVEALLRPSADGRPSEMVEVALRRRYTWPSRDEAAAYLRARPPLRLLAPRGLPGLRRDGPSSARWDGRRRGARLPP